MKNKPLPNHWFNPVSPLTKSPCRGLIITILLAQTLILLTYAWFRWQKDPTGIYTLRLYYEYSSNYLQGQIPYRDFAFEYPPLAFLPMLLPHFLKFGNLVSLAEYSMLFTIENIMLGVVGGLMLVSAIWRWQPKRSPIIPLTMYSLLIIVTAPINLYRYDLFPAVLTLMALILAYAERARLSGLFLSFGIAAKLYPVILLPIFSAYYLARRKYRAFLNLLIGSVGGILISLGLVWNGLGHMASFLSYHQARGLQIESVAAGIILLFKVFGLTEATTVDNFGALHIVSPLSNNVLKCLLPLSIMLFSGVIFLCFVEFRHNQRHRKKIRFETLAMFSVLMLLVFITTGKVFSTQYIIWLIPLVPILGISKSIYMLFISLVTIPMFSFLYHYLTSQKVGLVMLLNFRNLLVILFLVWLVTERIPKTLNKVRK